MLLIVSVSIIPNVVGPPDISHSMYRIGKFTCDQVWFRTGCHNHLILDLTYINLKGLTMIFIKFTRINNFHR